MSVSNYTCKEGKIVFHQNGKIKSDTFSDSDRKKMNDTKNPLAESSLCTEEFQFDEKGKLIGCIAVQSEP